MTDLIAASDIKDYITECPICREQFDEDSRIPRRMPCCVQSVCQPCLDTYSRGLQTLKCPMCRHQHHLPGGVKSLPKEPLILKILDYLKIQKGIHIACTDCRDNHFAVAQCEDCGVFLCKECLEAHMRVGLLKDHKTVTFEEMKGRSVGSFRRRHLCSKHPQQSQEFFCHTCDKVICVSCTVVEHDKGKGHDVVTVDDAHEDKAEKIEKTLSELDEKATNLSLRAAMLITEADSVRSYSQTATATVNHTFDALIEQLKLRRKVLLKEIAERSEKTLTSIDQTRKSVTESASIAKSASDYMKKMRSKADKIEDLELIVSSGDTLDATLAESTSFTKDVSTVVSFIPDKVRELTSVISETGLIKEATFSPKTHSDMQEEGEITQDLCLHWGATADYTSCETMITLATPDDSPPIRSPTTATLQQEKVSIMSCNVGDLVLLCLDERHDQYVVFTIGTTLHFLHTECLEPLGLKTVPGKNKKSWVLAEIMDTEYCQAKKPYNRFKVPVGTKFYRVKAKPWSREKRDLKSSALSECPPAIQEYDEHVHQER